MRAEPKPKRWQAAYTETRRRILTLGLPPGSPLSEAWVAREFGMSATPARDALGRLCQEGLVVVGPGRGYSVASLSVSDVAELTELRLVLETGIARLVMRYATPESLDTLRLLAGEVGEDLAPVERIQRNERFHLAVAELTGNHRLVGMLRAVLQDSQRVFHLGISELTAAEMAATHRRLVEAIAAGDVETTMRASEEDAYGTSERVITQLVRGPSRNGYLVGVGPRWNYPTAS